MHSTDLKVLTNLAPVAKSLMEKAGFKVDMQSMDWQTLVARRAKKDPPSAGGWNAFLTAWVAADVMNPVSTAYVNSACDKASFGWPCDAEMEKLRDDFARDDRSGQAEGDRGSGAVAHHRDHARDPGRRVRPAGCHAQERQGAPDGAGAGASGTSKSPSDVNGAGGGFSAARFSFGDRCPMYGYLFRRLLGTIPVMLVVAVFIFLMLRLTPSDPAAIIAGDNATTEQVAQIRSQLGLDRPMIEQFVIWSGKVLSGDFGESFFFKKTVAALIGERIEPTLSLAFFTILIAVLCRGSARRAGGAPARFAGSIAS